MEELREELIDLTKEMVGIQSMNPPGTEGKMAGYVQKYLDDIGIETKTVPLEEDNDDRRSVVGRIPGKEEGSIVLCGHLDTVGVKEENWNYPVLDATLEDGKIFGRGSADMKGGVAVILATSKKIMESKKKPEKDVVLALTAAEESNYGGAYSLVEQGYLDDADLLVVTEPTDGSVNIGEKGELWIDVNFSGKAAHGSTPNQGTNAVLMGAEFSTRIVKEIESLPADQLLGSTTINVGQFEGGWQVNVVPDEATIKLDIRVIRNEHKELAIKMIGDLGEELVDKYGGDFRFDVTIYQEPIASDTNEENITRFLQAAETGKKISEGSTRAIVPYCTDASAIVPDIQVPLIIYGPGKIEMAHQPDEYVEVSSLINSLNTFLCFFDIK